MSSIPLIEATDLPNEDTLYRVFQKGDLSIDHVLQRSKALGRWSVLSEERAHVETIDQLRDALKMLYDFQEQIRDSRPCQVMNKLGSLEQSMTAVGGVPAAVMKLLAVEVEAHLAPCPTAAQMKIIADRLANIGYTSVDTTPPTPIAGWAMWVLYKRDWGLYPGAPGPLEAGREKMFEAENRKFEDALVGKLAETEYITQLDCFAARPTGITDDYRQPMAGVIPEHKPMSIAWALFMNILYVAVGRSHGGVYTSPEIWMASLYDKKRTLLPWTTFGYFLEIMTQKGALTVEDLSGGTLDVNLEAEVRFG
jgi:hypothetical protein